MLLIIAQAFPSTKTKTELTHLRQLYITHLFTDTWGQLGSAGPKNYLVYIFSLGIFVF